MEGENKTLLELLTDIQAELNVPKDRHNDFGGFFYRSFESIVAAVKPKVKDRGLTLIMSDDLVEMNGDVYVKATARLVGMGEAVEASAYAREAESKKGSDVPQLTGMASSYARKYALCALFLIDGEGDPDERSGMVDGPDYKEPYRGANVTTREAAIAKNRCWRAVKAWCEVMGLDPKARFESFKDDPDFDDTEGYWTAKAVSYELSLDGKGES